MSDKLEPSTGKEGLLGRAMVVASLVRDIGVILGVPVLLTIGVKLYDLQTKALEDQIKANEAQIKSVEAQNSLLKETQYDRALALLKSQKEVFLMERNSLEKQIADLQTPKRQVEEINTEQRLIEAAAIKELTAKLSEVEEGVNSADKLIKLWKPRSAPMAPDARP
jgi:hypothetical protein